MSDRKRATLRIIMAAVSLCVVLSLCAMLCGCVSTDISPAEASLETALSSNETTSAVTAISNSLPPMVTNASSDDATGPTDNADPWPDMDRAALGTEPPEYLIGGGDVIELVSTATERINREYMVGPDGRITVPQLGVLYVGGLTREEIAQLVQTRLKPRFLDPAVDVLISVYNNNRIYVLGQVGEPGEYSFERRPRLLSALAAADGLSQVEGEATCGIIRGSEIAIEVDLGMLTDNGNRTADIPLKPGDIVHVRGTSHPAFYVLGEVRNPGIYSQESDTDIVRAIAEAGGLTEDGVAGNIRVIQRGGEQTTVEEVNLKRVFKGRAEDHVTIGANDIVYVPRRGIASFNYALEQIAPSINTILLGASIKNLSE